MFEITYRYHLGKKYHMLSYTLWIHAWFTKLKLIKLIINIKKKYYNFDYSRYLGIKKKKNEDNYQKYYLQEDCPVRLTWAIGERGALHAKLFPPTLPIYFPERERKTADENDGKRWKRQENATI